MVDKSALDDRADAFAENWAYIWLCIFFLIFVIGMIVGPAFPLPHSLLICFLIGAGCGCIIVGPIVIVTFSQR